MTKTIITAIAFALLSVVVGDGCRAQQTTTLTLGQMFELAERQNAEIGTARKSVDVSRQQQDVARAGRLPQISASLSLSYLGDGTILDRDFSNAMRDKLPHFSNQLGVEVYQPVYTGGAISGGIEMAKTQTALSSVGLDGVRNQIRMAIVSNYLELAKCHNLLAVYDENIALVEKLISEMQLKRDQGIVLKNDITRYELRLSTLRYDRLSTENAVKICNTNLISLLGLDESEVIVPTGLSTTPAASFPKSSVDEWMQSAMGNAPLLRSLSLQSSMESTARKITHAEYIPKIGLIAGDSFQGPITFEVPALDKNYNAWFVGVNVKWNISSLFTTSKSTRKHDLELARISSERDAAVDATGRNIREAFTLYGQAIERLEIERKNVRLAEENYEVVTNRFNNQIALLTDMLDASNARLDAGVRLVNAEISAQFYYYQLHFIAGSLTSL